MSAQDLWGADAAGKEHRHRGLRSIFRSQWNPVTLTVCNHTFRRNASRHLKDIGMADGRTNAKGSRKSWIDLARALAVAAVCMLHVAALIVSNFQNISMSDRIVGNIIDSSVRWCVPIFVMVSGHLMIDGAQTTSLRGFYRARLNRILVPLVFWSVLYVLLLPILRKCLLGVEFGNAFEPRRILTAIFIGRPYYHLWYLYMLLGLYAATPVLNILVAHCEKTLLGGSIVVLFCLSFLTQVWEQWGGWYPFFGIKFMYYLGYFLFPYFCRTYCPVVGWRPIVPVLIVSIIVTVLGAEIGMSEFGVDPDMGPYLYSSPNVVVMSLAIFLLLRDCSPRWGEFPIVRMISDNSFGIYLIHIVPLDIIQRTRVSPGALAERIGPVAALMGVSTVIFLASFMAVACMRRFPGLRRLV